MVDRGIQLGSVAAGLAVAFLASIPLLWLVTASAPEPSVAEAAAVEEASDTAIDVPQEQTTRIVVERPPVEVEGLAPAIVRVLEDAGNLRDAAPSELDLADSVVAVLIDNDVVLQVADNASPEEVDP